MGERCNREKTQGRSEVCEHDSKGEGEREEEERRARERRSQEVKKELEEKKDGYFALMYAKDGILYPAIMKKDGFDMLQAFCETLIKNDMVRYCEENPIGAVDIRTK